MSVFSRILNHHKLMFCQNRCRRNFQILQNFLKFKFSRFILWVIMSRLVFLGVGFVGPVDLRVSRIRRLWIILIIWWICRFWKKLNSKYMLSCLNCRNLDFFLQKIDKTSFRVVFCLAFWQTRHSLEIKRSVQEIKGRQKS